MHTGGFYRYSLLRAASPSGTNRSWEERRSSSTHAKGQCRSPSSRLARVRLHVRLSANHHLSLKVRAG